jgi:hypothetical protein
MVSGVILSTTCESKQVPLGTVPDSPAKTPFFQKRGKNDVFSDMRKVSRSAIRGATGQIRLQLLFAIFLLCNKGVFAGESVPAPALLSS